MKRVALVVTISAGLCGAAIACGEDEPAAPPPEPTPAEQPAPEAAPPDPDPAAERGTPGEDQAGATPPPVDQSDLECENEDVVCPMFEWMEENTKRAVEEGDVEAMAKAFHKIEFMTPVPEWDAPEHGDDGWVRISRRGAVLSEERNGREARRMCKACHEKWRDAFREQGFRTHPMVELPENAEAGRPDLQ